PEGCETGVGVFDRLQPAAKLAMLALVGTALGDENESCPELTALTEGTFGAVYAAIRQLIEFEIDLGREGPPPESHEFSMRALVLAAFRETHPDWENPFPEPGSSAEDDETVEVPFLPEPDCEDIDEWNVLL